MANTFLNLPALAANGPGTGVDVSAMGKLKSIVVSGQWGSTITPIITIEINNDPAQAGSWTAVASKQGGFTASVDVACKWMRVNVSNYRGGQAPDVDVGSDDSGTTFAALDVPASSDGAGTAIDVSALPNFKTIQCCGSYQGAVIIEVSEDGITSWSQIAAFQSGSPAAQSLVFAAHHMRARRSGVPVINPGLPVVNVGACSDGGGGGSVVHNNTLLGTGVAGDPLGVVAANQIDLTNDELADVAIGSAVYIDAPGGFKMAKADAAATTPALGLLLATTTSGATGIVQTGGKITLTTAQWDAICGTVGGLSANVP